MRSALLIMLSAFPASADGPLTFERVLTEARAHRQEIAASRARAEATKEVPRIVGALTEPMLMGGLDHLPLNLMGADYSVQLQQDFPAFVAPASELRCTGRRSPMRKSRRPRSTSRLPRFVPF